MEKGCRTPARLRTMNVLPLLLLTSVSEACLSKCKGDERAGQGVTLVCSKSRATVPMERVKSEMRDMSRTYRSLDRGSQHRVNELLSVENDMQTTFNVGLTANQGLPIDLTASFQERKDMMLTWVAVTNHGDYDAYLQVLEASAIDGRMKLAQQMLCLLDLITGPINCYFNYLFYPIEEADIPKFLTILKHHDTIYRATKFAYEHPEIDPEVLKKYPAHLQKYIPEIADVLITNINYFFIVFDPDTELYKTLPSHISDYPVPDFIQVYLQLKSQSPTHLFIAETMKFLGKSFTESQALNGQIKARFYGRLKDIRKKMDSQFQDVVRECGDVVITSKKKPRKPAVQHKGSKSAGRAERKRNESPREAQNEADPDYDAYRGVTDAQNVTQVTKKDGKNSSEVTLSEINSSTQEHLLAERKAQTLANKQARVEREAKRQERRHEKHLAKITEDDDADVKYYYTAQNHFANRVFEKNRAMKVCRQTYPASARFQHSIYPEITASGTTINFLCTLMVSGTPDYEGFCAAHADLGGILVEKKNGNKLFYFGEPIKYHKTLHRPHESSDFDHNLYRRFYRNCALHVYFFLLLSQY